MHLSQIEARDFRSLLDVTVPLRENVTVVIGENNSGKSNLLDAIRLVTDPLDGRRDRYWEAEDISRTPAAEAATLAAMFTMTSAEQIGYYSQGVLPDLQGVRYQVTFTPPQAAETRGRLAWTAGRGTTSDPDPEPEARKRLRHVYLQPLRDAQRELDSGAGKRLRVVLRYLLAETDQTENEFVEELRAEFQRIRREHPLVSPILGGVVQAVRAPLSDITAGASQQHADVNFADPTLLSIARSLRIRMNDMGLDPREIAESGLGYANLLFIATVVAELRAARDMDLTVFLVEEPEAHLHPQLQTLLLEYLRDAAAASAQQAEGKEFAGRIQVVVTTHSPLIAAATKVADLVVLKREILSKDAAEVGETQTAPPSEQSAEAFTSGQESETPEGRCYQTRAIPLGEIVSGLAAAKLDRYLDTTKSIMLFGPRVVLVEGLAEALLIPAFADRVLPRAPREPLFGSVEGHEGSGAELSGEAARAARARFVGSTLVPIEGVDFEPYLRVLLATYRGACVADRVAIITDGDPKSPGDRRHKLGELARELGATDRCAVFVAQPTLEPELLCASDANLPVVEAAYKAQRPQKRDEEWQHILSPDVGEERVERFMAAFSNHKIRKGDFAQEVAAAAGVREDFIVPDYLQRAIRWIAGVESTS